VYLAILTIPAPYQPGVSALASLPETAYRQLLDALSRAPSTFNNQRELVAWIASEVKSIPPAEVVRIIRTLVSLYRLRSRQPNTSVQEIAKDVAIAAREIPNFTFDESIDFIQRLASLLVLDSLNTTALKAKELQLESERTFCEARIITDIRPVFGDNIDEAPTMMIVHTLKIGFHEPEHKDMYVALDAADIIGLKKTLGRAEEKANKLKTILDAAGIRSIDLP
jgi:hypothetical protein